MSRRVIESARSVLGQMARAIGCELVPEWRLDRLGLARHLRAIFDRYAVDVVLDVGANRGQYRDFLRQDVGYRGDVVSFEPIPEMAEALRARARDDRRWRIYQCALGRQVESRAFNIMQGSELSSFKVPDTTQVPELARWNQVARVEQVSVRTLDEVWRELQVEHRHARPFLKLDTQGYDAEVLAGGGGVLPGFVGLQSEVHVLPLYENTPRYLEEIAHLEAMNMDVSGLFIVSSDRSLRAIEFDCVMLRREIAGAGVAAGAPR